MSPIQTREYKKLQENFDKVVHFLGAVQVTNTLADKLFARKLITSEMLEMTNLRKIIFAVLVKVENDPTNYHTFLQVLNDISGVEDVVKILTL